MKTGYPGRAHKLQIKSIDDDLVLFDDIKQIPYWEHPVRSTTIITFLVLKGQMEIGIDLKRYVLEAPCISFCGIGQIIQYFNASDDLSVAAIGMSRSFGENLQMSLQQLLAMFSFFKNNSRLNLKDSELELLLEYYSLLRKTINRTNDIYRLETALLLVKAFFFVINSISLPYVEKAKSDNNKSRQQVILEDFFSQVRDHYKGERSLEFYAEKLCLSPKHLSEVIKKTTGKSANNWIEDFVCLEAKALLKSTNMTIQQVSDELNFPSQSFFGKYFKRVTGISPRNYKTSK